MGYGDDRSPFGKARTELPIFGQSIAQSVKTLRDLFAGEMRHCLGAFIHLDAGNDPLLLQCFNESATITSLLPNRLVEENYTADKFARTGCGK